MEEQTQQRIPKKWLSEPIFFARKLCKTPAHTLSPTSRVKLVQASAVGPRRPGRWRSNCFLPGRSRNSLRDPLGLPARHCPFASRACSTLEFPTLIGRPADYHKRTDNIDCAFTYVTSRPSLAWVDFSQFPTQRHRRRGLWQALIRCSANHTNTARGKKTMVDLSSIKCCKAPGWPK